MATFDTGIFDTGIFDTVEDSPPGPVGCANMGLSSSLWAKMSKAVIINTKATRTTTVNASMQSKRICE